jgi:uncharacterized membrane protein HdeD (DUF308 family)
MKRLTAPHIDINALERETGFGWVWFVFLGIASIILGALAFLNLLVGSPVSLYAVGIVMLIGALAQLGTPILAPHWKGFGLLVLSAIFYGAAGILVTANPTLVARTLTLMLAFALILSGTMRISLGVVMPYLPGWGWVGASGLVSVGAGLVFVSSSPANAVWVDGIVLAVDLAFQGVMAIAFGATLKAIAK